MSSVRKRKFAVAIADGKSQTEAAVSAGYAPTRAAVTGSELMKDPEVIVTLSALLDAQGVSRKDCLDAIAKGLSSENEAASLKSAEMGLKLHGAFREAEAEPESGGDDFIKPGGFERFCKKFWEEKVRRSEERDRQEALDPSLKPKSCPNCGYARPRWND